MDNPTSLGYLVSAARKIENHATRTLFLLDYPAALAGAAAVKDAASQQNATAQIGDLTKRLDALRRETRVIADEMDQLAFGSVSKLIWGGGTEEQTTSVAGDTTGYHQVLASLAELNKQLAEAGAALRR